MCVQDRAGSEALLTDYEGHLKLKNRRPLTRSTYLGDVRGFSAYLSKLGKDLTAVDTPDLAVYLQLLERDLDLRTVKKKLFGLRSFYTWLRSTGRIQYDPTEPFHYRIDHGRRRTPLSEAEIELVLSGTDLTRDTPLARALHFRDRAIRELLYAAGLRAAEVCTLTVANVDLHTGRIRVIGKGDKHRDVAVAGPVLALMVEYRGQIREFPMGQGGPGDAFFLSADGGGLTRQRIYQVVKAAYQNAFPHRLRHSCATHLRDHGASLPAIQRQLGNEHPETTLNYLAPLNQDQLKTSHDRFCWRARKPERS